MVRIMQADPKLGILQGLVVGMPSTSAFARIFQFGMRLGMRSYTHRQRVVAGRLRTLLGPQRDHPPRAVHRALRTAGAAGERRARRPYAQPRPDRGGADAPRRLRGARAAARKICGWEENPPTLIEFIRRDLRWCQGNMQYWHFLVHAGPEARQPLPARVRDADVPRLAGLDRAAACSARWRVALRRHAGELHPARRRHRAVRHHAGHVVRAEDRDA